MKCGSDIQVPVRGFVVTWLSSDLFANAIIQSEKNEFVHFSCFSLLPNTYKSDNIPIIHEFSVADVSMLIHSAKKVNILNLSQGLGTLGR